MGALISCVQNSSMTEQRLPLLFDPPFSRDNRYPSEFLTCCGYNTANQEVYLSREDALDKGRKYLEINSYKALEAFKAALEFSTSPNKLTTEYVPPKMYNRNDVSYEFPISKYKSKDDELLIKNVEVPLVTYYNNEIEIEQYKSELENGQTISNCAPFYQNSLNRRVKTRFPDIQEITYPNSDGINSTIDSSNQSSRYHSDYEKEDTYKNQVSSFDPKTAETCDAIGQLYFSNQKYLEAINWFNKAILLDPTKSSYLYHKGVVYQTEGNLSVAEENFLKALELEPDSTAVRFNLGVILIDGNTESALNHFNYILKNNPNHTEVMSLIAHCYEKQGIYEEAIQQLQLLLLIDSKNYQAIKRIKELNEKIMNNSMHSRSFF